jgi:hypothetical protein
MTRAPVLQALGALGVVAGPLLLPVIVSPAALPHGLAFAVTSGRWLGWLGLAAAVLSLAIGNRVRVWTGVGSVLDRVPARAFRLAVAGGALLLALLLIPGHRWSGATLTGDEPKYLVMAESLYRDLDVDVSGDAGEPVTLRQFAANLRALGRSTANALLSLARTPFGADAPEGHRWSLGNWTIAGRQGGVYYVQSPGLPVVLAPAVALQRSLAPHRRDPLVPLLTLALLWSITVLQVVLLAVEVSGSRLAGVAAGLVAALSTPVFVGGYHFYPESAAAPLVPWIARFARRSGPALDRLRSAGLGLAAGTLPWLHPKFLLLAVAALVLLLRRVLRDRPRLALSSVGFLAPLFALLLFDHHVTGLARPDAFYQRFADPLYTGPASVLSPALLTGFVNALFGARDGLLVMAPVLVAALLALPRLWRRDRTIVIDLGALFAALWIAAATHQGGAPGPPGRLMGPVAALLAAPLAVGLAELRPSLPFRWATAALAVVTLAITVTMLGDWRRAVNPYRGFAAESRFDLDLPDGPRDVSHVSPAVRRAWDLARAGILTGVLAFWAWRLNRPRPQSPRWRSIVNLGAGFWGTLALVSSALHALGP